MNNDFFQKIKDYNPIGQKKDEYKEYQKLNFIQRFTEDIRLEDIEGYSLALGQLYQYAQLAMKIRKGDVIKRYMHNVKLKEEREAAIQQEKDRQEERGQYLEDEAAKWEEEHKKPEKKEGEGEQDEEEPEEAEGEGKEEEQFDEAAVLAKFDQEKEPIVIPPEVVDDIDNDIELTEDDMNPPQE